METSQKRADPPGRLRVPTQRGLRTESEPAGLSVSRLASAAVRRLRTGLLPLACAVFVASAALSLLVLPGDAVGTGVTSNSLGVVTNVDPNSVAWAEGVRPGWLVGESATNIGIYTHGEDQRLVATGVPASGPVSLPSLIPALILLIGAGLAAAAGQRRASSTLAVAAAVVAAGVWATRSYPTGDAFAVLPIGFAAALSWQMADGVGIRPISRPLPALNAVALAGLVVASGAAFAGAGLAFGLVAGVAAASIVLVACAWPGVVRWRAAAAVAAGATSPLVVARAVAVDMLPFSDRVRRHGAIAERNRLASDLHAEVLPAIASTAAALERRGANDEAEELRGLAASVRDLVSDRRLPVLEDSGLVAAAEWLAESLQTRAGLTIEIELDGYDGTRQPQTVERAAYRILQLALENVIRHAQAVNATVSIAGGGQSLALTVADDGKGIDRKSAVRAMNVGRLGLADMRTEADSIRASLEIAPRSPKGTTVSLRWRA